jgi:hypothetical protein
MVAGYREVIITQVGISEVHEGKNVRQETTFWTDLHPENKLMAALKERLSGAKTILPGDRLGEGLDSLIDYLANPEAAQLRRLYADGGMAVTLIVDRFPSAVTRVTSPRGHIEINRYMPSILSPAFLPAQPLAPLRRETTIPFSLLEVLADLWADTLAHRAGKAQSKTASPSSDPASGSAGEEIVAPETTKAAWTGIHDGLQTGRPATPADTALNSVEPTLSGEREATRNSQADRSSTPYEGDRRDAEREHYSPHPAAA